MLGAERLSVGWYFGRLNALISAVVIMFVYLGEIKRAYFTSVNVAQQMVASCAQLEVAVEQALVDDLTGPPSRALFLQQAGGGWFRLRMSRPNLSRVEIHRWMNRPHINTRLTG